MKKSRPRKISVISPSPEKLFTTRTMYTKDFFPFSSSWISAWLRSIILKKNVSQFNRQFSFLSKVVFALVSKVCHDIFHLVGFFCAHISRFFTAESKCWWRFPIFFPWLEKYSWSPPDGQHAFHHGLNLAGQRFALQLLVESAPESKKSIG